LTQTIEITVSPTGETKLETRGFSGSACRDASSALQQALGVTLSDLATRELYLQQPASGSIQLGGAS
jgi:hypothetical protein